MSTINSSAYWDQRFRENWESHGGPTQSRFFARMAIEHLPHWLKDQIRSQHLSLADWGCGQGDGTDVWTNVAPAEQIVGVDFSSVAIGQARRRYPSLRFINVDWLSGVDARDESFDVVFSSNTLEHFHDSREVLQTISGHARRALVLALPYRELDRIEEHFVSFVPENIPAQLANGFGLTWSKVVDCSQIQGAPWGQQQIVLVYADPAWLADLSLTLSGSHIEQDDVATQMKTLERAVVGTRQEVADLRAEVAERNGAIAHMMQRAKEHEGVIARVVGEAGARDGEIARLVAEAGVRDGEIARLAVEAAARDGEIARLVAETSARDGEITRLVREASDHRALLRAAEAYRNDKEIYIAQLLLDIKTRARGFPGLAWHLQQTLTRLPGYVKRSRALVATEGIGALFRVLRAKLARKWLRSHGAAPHRDGPSEHTRVSAPLDDLPALLPDELVIITGVPFDDVGGGQRAAQLARCALRTGRRVIYLHLYPKYDFATGALVASDVHVPGMTHQAIDTVDPAGLLGRISQDATILIELPHPGIVPFLDACNARGLRTVFELIDDWETSLGGDWFDMETYRRFVATSSVVVGTAKCLVQRLVEAGREDAVYLPNASNEYIFDKYASFARPADLPGWHGRTALYFGSLYGEWFAWEWVIAAANANPDLQIALIGDSPAIAGLPDNVRLLGAKRIEELPGYLQHADMALLPFLPGKISDAVSPIKIFEYLFAGRRVISTRIPEVLDYPGVRIADTPEEFARLCGREEDPGQLVQDNDRFIFNNSWFSRLDALVGEATRERFADSVSAIILIHNNRSIIGRCLESLLLHGRGILREVIVVDNASSDGGAAYVAERFPDVRLIVNPVNGCASGRNLGVALATGKYLAFFDSDQWFTSASFLVEALQILSRDASVGAVGWAAGWFDRTRTDLGGMVADGCHNRAMNQDALRHGYRADIGYLGTGGFFVPRSVFDATGGFDTSYDPTCFEDTDISFQIKHLGLKVGYRDLTGIRHQPHQTTRANAGGDAYRTLFRRNGDYFKRKWKAHPEYFLDYPGY